MIIDSILDLALVSDSGFRASYFSALGGADCLQFQSLRAHNAVAHRRLLGCPIEAACYGIDLHITLNFWRTLLIIELWKTFIALNIFG